MTTFFHASGWPRARDIETLASEAEAETETWSSEAEDEAEDSILGLEAGLEDEAGLEAYNTVNYHHR